MESSSALLDVSKILAEIGIKTGETVADFGCGSLGHFVFPAAELVGSSGRVLAVDIQPGVLSAIKSAAQLRGISNVEPLWADIERPGGVRVKDGSVNVSLLVNNLFLAREKERLVDEIRRLTALSGRFLVIDWLPRQTAIGPRLEDRISATDAQALFERHGFAFERSLEVGPYHWGILLRRVS